MNYFTNETYNLLKSNKREAQRTDPWYNATYENYISVLEDNKHQGSKGFYSYNAFILSASFAFSWLARIPTFYKDGFNIEEPVKIIHHLHNIDAAEFDTQMDEEMIIELVSIFDNSVVAVSKMVHFLSPDYFPIIDSKVIITWNQIFPEHKLPKTIDIARYLEFSQKMRTWSVETGIKLRDLEIALFQYQQK